VNELLGHLAVPANITGLPSITLPGRTDSAGLPIGIQLIGRERSDRRLIKAATGIAPYL
jgi:aspartyl-tRNA(Asn)/glutamyl-tRNA(Gln) amidotransferase subunit A